MKRISSCVLFLIYHFSFSSFGQSLQTDSTFTFFQREKDDSVKVNKLVDIAKTLRRRPADSLIRKMSLLNALSLAQKIEYKYGLADVYDRLGEYFDDRAQFIDALRQYSMAVNIAEEGNFFVIKAHAISHMGTIYAKQSNYKEALKNYLTALKLYEAIKDQKAIANNLNNVGIVYSKMENFHEAFNYFSKVLEMDEASNNKYGMYNSYMNIGATQRELASQLKKLNISLDSISSLERQSLDNAFKSLKLAMEIRDSIGIAGSFLNIGIGFADLEEYEKAIDFDNLALKIFEAFNDRYGMRISYTNRAEHLFKQSLRKNALKKNLSEILEDLNIALDLEKSAGTEGSTYEVYAMVYNSVGNYKKAYEYTDLWRKARDSALNNDILRKTEQLRIQYEAEKAETLEKAKQEGIQRQLKFDFAKKEDSLKYQQKLTQEQLKQQTLLGIQRQQELELQQASLSLSNQQKEIIRLSFLRSQSDLLAEQSQRKEKERQLTIVDKENALHLSQLQLQKVQLSLKENQLQSEKTQRNYYIGGIALLLLALFFIIRDFKNRQKANAALASEKLKTQKAEAIHKMAELELQSLRAQLNPHFMFNSLNAIQELVLMEDNERSHIYLSAFADLLRMLLDNANQAFIPLKKEIEFLQLYLSLENLRIPNLQYSIHVDEDVSTNKINIPNMILQPYIENAIWHGLSHKKEDKQLSIHVHQRLNNLVFQIEDNGVGRKKATELKSLYHRQHQSKGMELLSKRFSLLTKEYATEIKTKVTDLYVGERPCGTLVEVIVPLSLSEKFKEVAYDTYNYN